MENAGSVVAWIGRLCLAYPRILLLFLLGACGLCIRRQPLAGLVRAPPVGAATADGKEKEHQQQTRDGKEGGDKGGGINVPRQRYIAVPKAALLDVALSLFPSQPAADDFRRFARCLHAVLHAEHKETLKQMRTYYMLPDDEEGEVSGQASGGNESAATAVNGRGSGLFGMSQDGNDDDDRMSFLSRSLDWKTLLGLSPDPAPVSRTRVAFATHFQRAFMNLLRNAQFE